MRPIRLFNRYMSQRHLTVFTGELLLIAGSMGFVLHHYSPDDEFSTAVWKGAVVSVLCMLCLYYNDLYDLTVVRTTREVFIRLLQSVGSALILIALLYILMPWLVVADGASLPAFAILLTGILAWRLVFNHFTRLRSFGERVLIVGTDATAQTIARQISTQDDFGYDIVGFIGDDESPVTQTVGDWRVIGALDDIDRVVARYAVDRLIVGMSDRRGRLPVRALLRSKLRGIRVEDVNTVYERLTGKLLVEDLRPSWLIFSDDYCASRWTRRSKRVFDILLALVVLVLSTPFLILTALAVWLESGSPILYRQERVGENGRLFTLNKFRSMRKDAEQGTPVWAQAEDDRVTRVGRLIRKTRLDELPQLWNVLRGDMSFVGPRPERPFFVNQLAEQVPFYEQRHAVKPGITGWAQVKYRYGASFEDSLEKLRYDLYYVKHLSIPFDLTILFDTVKVVLFAKGAR
jgi:sugar transferase (PEP-CTERM system associated)